MYFYPDYYDQLALYSWSSKKLRTFIDHIYDNFSLDEASNENSSKIGIFTFISTFSGVKLNAKSRKIKEMHIFAFIF